MTIRVTVKNEDSRESAVIGAFTQHVTLDGVVVHTQLQAELKGGETTELYVHTGQQILIRELRQ